MAALTYQTAYDGAFSDANLGHRCVLAGVKVAQTVWAAENGTGPEAVLATAVLNQPGAMTDTWLAIVATDPAVVAAGAIPTDAQITTAIQNAWAAVAGI